MSTPRGTATGREAKGDVTKLPKWAQEYIYILERDHDHYLARLNEGEDESNTFADPYSEGKRPLGMDTSVAFYPGNESDSRRIAGYFMVSLNCDPDGKRYLDVYSNSGRIEIEPRASNAIIIRGNDF